VAHVSGRQEAFDVIDFSRYRDRLRQLHERLEPRTYLEIGVAAGRSLALANPSTVAVGVDPALAIEVELGPQTRLVEEPSDDFFAGWDVAALFDGIGIDLAFIDGLHLFEQALRDLTNVAEFLAPGGCIVLHDTLPYNRIVAQRRRTTQKWTGDVWKVVECLRHERPDLSLVTIDVPPTGLTLVRGLDPGDTALLDDHERLVASYVDLPADGYERVRSEWNVVADGDGVVAELACAELA
jgi:SAM-dependent methyltransferase